MIDFISKDRYCFADLVALVHLLRVPGGCPWDGAQTHESIRRNFLEEAYEVCEAFDRDDPAMMREELGDVLLQVLFHADIEQDAGRFTLDDVCDTVCKKLIFRHPLLFGGDASLDWEALKRREKGQRTATETLDAVARSLPACWRAEKIQNKAAKAGFAWESVSGALEKLEEELSELRSAVSGHTNVEEEVGDVLFAAVNAASCLSIDPEMALHAASEKFIRRFGAMEQAARARGVQLANLSRSDLLQLWNEQKPSNNRKEEQIL